MQQPTFLQHWGRHWRLLILPVMAVCFAVSLSFVAVGPDPDIDAAQAWFADKYPSPQFMGISVSPNWSSARKVTAPSGALYVEVPLDKTIQSNIGNADGSALSSSETAAVNGTLTLVVELYNGTYSALYFRVTATRNYVNANGKATVLQTKFDQVQSNFSGVLEYFTMESQSTKGIFVENGVPTKVARTQQQLTGQVEDRCVQTDTWTIFYAISGGGSSSPTFDVISTTHTTMFSPDCFDQPMLPDDYAAGQNAAFWFNNGQNNPYNPPPPPPPPAPVCIVSGIHLYPSNPPFNDSSIDYTGTCEVANNTASPFCHVTGYVSMNPGYIPLGMWNYSIVNNVVSGNLDSGNPQSVVHFYWVVLLTFAQNPIYVPSSTDDGSYDKVVTFNPQCCKG